MIEELERELCSKSCHTFIFGLEMRGSRRHFVLTKDEHDLINPIKPFPDEPAYRAYVDLLLISGGFLLPAQAIHALAWGFDPAHLQRLHDTHILFLEKSRQVLMTWYTCAYLLWRAKFHPHQLILVQGKRAEDIDALVCLREGDNENARIAFMENHLPGHLKDLDFTRKGATRQRRLYFPNGSEIAGIPQGKSIIRSRTPSVLFSDEAAFQPEFDDAYGAALPAINGGGQGIFISSMELSPFSMLTEALEAFKE
jgi:hypothetical protein